MRRMRDARRSRWGVASCLVRVNYKKCCLHLIVTNSKYRHLMISANFRCHSIIKMGTQLLRICSLGAVLKCVGMCAYCVPVWMPTHTYMYVHRERWTHLLEMAYAYLLIPFVANPIDFASSHSQSIALSLAFVSKSVFLWRSPCWIFLVFKNDLIIHTF